MRRRWAAALAVAAFAAGAAAGVAGAKAIASARRAADRADPRERVVARLDRLAERLDLDADQRARWDEAARAFADEVAESHREARRRVREIKRRHIENLRAILRPEQAERLDEIIAGWERRRSGPRSAVRP